MATLPDYCSIAQMAAQKNWASKKKVYRAKLPRTNKIYQRPPEPDDVICLQVQQAMQPARVAFELAPRERAAYMKRELGPGQSEEDSTTLGGALPASLRSWLRQVFPKRRACSPRTCETLVNLLLTWSSCSATLGGALPACKRCWV